VSSGGCFIEGCDGLAAFMPIFQIPDGDGGLAGVAFSLVVCATCKISVTKEQLLTDGGRKQIEIAVFGKLGIEVDWTTVEMVWDPIPQPGEGSGVHFEAHYRANDPAIAHVWDEAVNVYNAFVEAAGNDEVMASTRIAALAVVVLCEGYKRYRADDEAGGQLFLSSTFRSLIVQVEDQTGDDVKIGVGVTTKDRHAR
jgi:hypothetical protein